MSVSKKEICDVTEWDSNNWGKAISFIDSLNLEIEGRRVLEIGSRNGGMSLFFANRGARCTCTDLTVPGEKATEKHRRWGVEEKVEYAALDATSFPDSYDGCFDLVTFKSVLGGVGSYNNVSNETAMVEGIKKALKSGGYVVFIENMKGTALHDLLRKEFRKHGSRWHYQTDESISALFKDFELIGKKFYGFLGLFGPNEKCRRFLGTIDRFFDVILPQGAKYVGVYVYRKKKPN